jgi:hypothetical protein
MIAWAGAGGSGRMLANQATQSLHNNSACAKTVRVACSCLSGGYPCARKMHLTTARMLARTLSSTVQSMNAFFLPASTKFQSNLPERFITQDFHCAIVHLKRVIDGDSLIAHLELVAPALGLTHVLG